tara:strand:- start:606 stop:926 length:321 start_codon:yes stop_codon:yes gene_type:complete
MDGFLYCTATNSGKGFITHQDRHDFYIRGFVGNVWVVEKNIESAAWISRVSGTSKTYTEAQAIVDTQVTNAQNAWDANNVDGESADEKIDRIGSKPTDTKIPYLPS